MVRIKMKLVKFYKDLSHRASQKEHMTEMNRPSFDHNNITLMNSNFRAEHETTLIPINFRDSSTVENHTSTINSSLN
jgi:hypothetical protein